MDTGLTVFAVCIFAAIFIFALIKGIVQIHEQRVASQKTRTKALELKAKALEEDRKIREIDAMTSRAKRAADVRDEAMGQLDEIRKRASTYDVLEYWQGVAVGMKGALVLLGRPDSQEWEQETRVKEILDMVVRHEEEEEES